MNFKFLANILGSKNISEINNLDEEVLTRAEELANENQALQAKIANLEKNSNTEEVESLKAQIEEAQKEAAQASEKIATLETALAEADEKYKKLANEPSAEPVKIEGTAKQGQQAKLEKLYAQFANESYNQEALNRLSWKY